MGRQRGSPPRPRSAPGRGGLGRLAPAWAADVVSSNVVGYQKLQLQDGYNLIANGFRVVGTDDAAALQDMFSDMETNGTGTPALETSDNIKSWTGTGYSTYWYYDGGDGDATYDKKWYNFTDDSTPTTDGLDATDGAWYISRGQKTLTIAGEVSKTAAEVHLQDGYNLVANPFPAAISLNGSGIDWAAMGITGTAALETSDNIKTWTGTGYTTYWFYDGGDGDATYDKKWYNFTDDSTPTTDSIAAGAGFWLIHRGAATTLTLVSPIAE